MRNRLPGLTDNHAGNYESSIVFGPTDFSANKIRAALQPTSGYRPPAALANIPRRDLPGSWRTAFGSTNITIVSSWASFYTDVIFKDCRQSIHMPVNFDINVSGILWWLQ